MNLGGEAARYSAGSVSVVSVASIVSATSTRPSARDSRQREDGHHRTYEHAFGGDADLDTFPADGPQQDLVFSTVATPEFADDGTYEGATYDYGWKAGTSMAAPQVTGAAALVKSENTNYDANQLESSLKRAASVPEGYDKAYYGSGFLDIVGVL